MLLALNLPCIQWDRFSVKDSATFHKYYRRDLEPQVIKSSLYTVGIFQLSDTEPCVATDTELQDGYYNGTSHNRLSEIDCLHKRDKQHAPYWFCHTNKTFSTSKRWTTSYFRTIDRAHVRIGPVAVHKGWTEIDENCQDYQIFNIFLATQQCLEST